MAPSPDPQPRAATLGPRTEAVGGLAHPGEGDESLAAFEGAQASVGRALGTASPGIPAALGLIPGLRRPLKGGSQRVCRGRDGKQGCWMLEAWRPLKTGGRVSMRLWLSLPLSPGLRGVGPQTTAHQAGVGTEGMWDSSRVPSEPRAGGCRSLWLGCRGSGLRSPRHTCRPAVEFSLSSKLSVVAVKLGVQLYKCLLSFKNESFLWGPDHRRREGQARRAAPGRVRPEAGMHGSAVPGGLSAGQARETRVHILVAGGWSPGT